LSLLVEAREDLGGVVVRQETDQLHALFVVQVCEDLRDVLGVNLLQEISDLLRTLVHERQELRTDEAGEPHAAS
jgi:hypothetical protein